MWGTVAMSLLARPSRCAAAPMTALYSAALQNASLPVSIYANYSTTAEPSNPSASGASSVAHPPLASTIATQPPEAAADSPPARTLCPISVTSGIAAASPSPPFQNPSQPTSPEQPSPASTPTHTPSDPKPPTSHQPSAPVPGSDAGPGPSSGVLGLMRLIRVSRSAVDLRMALSRHEGDVDHVALVAAMTRLAQIHGTGGGSRREHEQQRELLSALATQLAGPASPHRTRCGPRQIASCLHLLAEVHVKPSQAVWSGLLGALTADRASMLVRQGNGQDVATVALALSRLGCRSRGAWRAVALGAEAQADRMTPQQVANTLSALARAVAVGGSGGGGAGGAGGGGDGASGPEFDRAFGLLLARAAADVEGYTGRNLANAVWAGVRHMRAQAATRHAPGPSGSEPDAAAAFGFDGVEDAEQAAAAAAAQDAPDSAIAAADLASDALMGGAAGAAEGPQLAAIRLLAARLPERFRQCTPTELSRAAWALARLGWREGRMWNSLGRQLRVCAGALSPDEVCVMAESLQFASIRLRQPAPTSAAAAASNPTATLAAGSSSSDSGSTAAAAADASVSASEDPAAHLVTLFAAASMRVRDMRPLHLVRLLRVAAAQQQQLLQRGPQQAEEQQQAEKEPLQGRKNAEDEKQVLQSFVDEARAQLLQLPGSAFTRMWLVASLVASLSQLPGSSRGGTTGHDAASAASTTATTAANGKKKPSSSASSTSTSALSSEAGAPSSSSLSAALMDRLAVAAAERAGTAAPGELRMAAAAFARAGHFNAQLCSAIASRVEALARASAPTSPSQPVRSAKTRDATVATTSLTDLLGVLQSLGQLSFQNEAALTAALPAVATTLPALPPRALTAAIEAYGNSGAPPLGLMSALAGELVARVERLEGGVQTGVAAEGAGGGVLGVLGLGEEERGALQAACVQWRKSVLYGAGLGDSGAATNGGATVLGDLGAEGRDGRAAEGAMDRCSQLLLLLGRP